MLPLIVDEYSPKSGSNGFEIEENENDDEQKEKYIYPQ